MNPQASLELRKLKIYNSPSLQKLPKLIEMFSHLEELDINNSLEKTDTTSLVQSIKQLSNLRSLQLQLRSMSDGFFSWNFDLSMDRLETIELVNLQNMSKLVICGEMCPRLQNLLIFGMDSLDEMELKKLERLNTLQVNNCAQLETISGLSTLIGLQKVELKNCAGLKWLPTLSHLRHLEEIRVVHCPELQSLEGAEELPILKSLFIRIPSNEYASWTLPVKKVMQIIVDGKKATSNVSSKLNANLFSEVIGAQEVGEIWRGEYGLHDALQMSSSSSAITIYVLFATSQMRYNDVAYLDFEFEDGYDSYFMGDCLIIVVLTQHDIEGSLSNVRVKKGIKVTMKAGEEGKALTVLKRIAHSLYQGRCQISSE